MVFIYHMKTFDFYKEMQQEYLTNPEFKDYEPSEIDD